MAGIANKEPQSSNSLLFDPDEYPENTLKAYNDYVELFELRYNAQFPDPPKVSLDSALERWKVVNATERNPNPRPTLHQYDKIKEDWQAKDRLTKFLGLFSSARLHSDWQVAMPNEKARKIATWKDFVDAMKEYYKPTQNPTLKNFKCRELTQAENETFQAFCNRVEKEARRSYFKCEHNECNVDEIVTRHQVVIGTTNNMMREEFLLKSRDLQKLCTEGMKIESESKGGAEIAGDSLYKLGKYSYKNIKTSSANHQVSDKTKKKLDCYFCGQTISNLKQHIEKCVSRKSTCSKCNKKRHIADVCRSIRRLDKHEDGYCF